MNKNHEDELATAESMLTDAIFKCPAKNCASKLSFSEFFDGDCCNELKLGLSFQKFNKYHVDYYCAFMWADSETRF